MKRSTLCSEARAHANIALAKYWGKTDARLNLPAVPSISLTLDALYTDTEVIFDPRYKSDALFLQGERASDAECKRAVSLLNRVRKLAGFRHRARIVSHNNFPTASGLASSASGFAALAAAAADAAHLELSPKKLSALARASSASAARSVFGGFVELPSGKKGDANLAARQIASEEHWDLAMIIAITTRERKKIGSTDAMERARKTSPLYKAWLEEAPKWSRKVKRAIRDKDLKNLGQAMESSTFAFHATAMTSTPSILYWNAATTSTLQRVQELRETGLQAWATMDAGPHVKVLCREQDITRIRRVLASIEGVERTLVARPGPGISACP